MSIDRIIMESQLEEGAEIYITPACDEDSETLYVLSNESCISEEMRLSEAEKVLERNGFVWCETSGTFKAKASKRLIEGL